MCIRDRGGRSAGAGPARTHTHTSAFLLADGMQKPRPTLVDNSQHHRLRLMCSCLPISIFVQLCNSLKVNLGTGNYVKSILASINCP